MIEFLQILSDFACEAGIARSVATAAQLFGLGRNGVMSA